MIALDYRDSFFHHPFTFYKHVQRLKPTKNRLHVPDHICRSAVATLKSSLDRQFIPSQTHLNYSSLLNKFKLSHVKQLNACQWSSTLGYEDHSWLSTPILWLSLACPTTLGNGEPSPCPRFQQPPTGRHNQEQSSLSVQPVINSPNFRRPCWTHTHFLPQTI